MGWTQRLAAHNFDGITAWDSFAPSATSYAADATAQSATQDLLACVVALKTAGLPSWVQSASFCSAASVNSSTAAATFTTNNAAGSCIVVDMGGQTGYGGSGASFLATISVSDTQGNAYALVKSDAYAPGTGVFSLCFVALNIIGGANTVTVTTTLTGGNSFNDYAIAVHEYSGIAPVSAFDAGAVGSDIHSTGTVSLSLTTTGPNELLHFFSFIRTYLPVTASGGGTSIPQGWYIAYELAGSPATGSYVDRSTYLYLGQGFQHSITQQVRQRGKASYTLRVLAGDSYLPTMFQPVFLFDQNASGYTLEFSGIVQDFKERFIDTKGNKYIDVTAVSLESVFDTVCVTTPKQYVNQTCGFILTDLFNSFETGAPVALGTIQGGATVPLFNAQMGDKLWALFTELATTSLFNLWVNPQTQQLNFALPTAIPAPFSITSNLALWPLDTMSLMYDGADYRNRQGVKLSYDAFSHSMEFFAGAGQQTVTLMRPVKQVVAAYVTLSTCGTATITFTGQPSAGDTITIGPLAVNWAAGVTYAAGGQIVESGFVQKVTTAAGIPTTGSPPVWNNVTGDTTTDSAGNIWTCQGTSGLSTGTATYTFVLAAALDNTQFGQVAIQSTLALTIQALVDAINANAATRGSTFSLPTWENSQCNAITVTGTTFVLQQKAAGSGWVAAIAISSSHFSSSSPTTTGGTSPQGSVGPNQGATITIQVYAQGTSTAAPGLAYTEGSAVLTLATPLNSGTNLNVEYTRQDGNVVQVEDTALVTALAVTTKGTGKNQQFTDASSQGLISTNAAAGLQLAQQALAAYSPIPQEFELRILLPGLTAGMQLVIALTGALSVINGTYYIEELQADLIPVWPYLDRPQAPGYGHYRYTLKLINTNQIGSYMDFWQGLGGGSGGGGGVGGALVATSGGAQSSTPQPFPQDFSRTTNSGRSFISGTSSGFDDFQYELATFSDSTSQSCVFHGNFNGANFENADLTGSTFTGNFVACNFENCTLTNCTFSGQFQDCNFENTLGTGITATGSNFNGSSFANAGTITGTFDGSTFAGCNFANAILSGSSFQGSNLQGVQFFDCTLDSVNFAGVPGTTPTCLVGASFININFNGTIFDGADLSGATFFQCGQVGTDPTFGGCNFTGVRFCDISAGGPFELVHAVSASYSVAQYDANKLISIADASPHTSVTITLPATPPSDTWQCAMQNASSYSATLSPNGLLIDGVSGSLSIPAGAGVNICSDGTNYFTERGMASGGGGGVTAVTGTAPVTSSGGTTPAIGIAAATSSALGVVKPDGTIITVAAGAITVAKASSSAFGVVEVDGTTITAAAGVISAVGGGGGGSGFTTQTSYSSPTRQAGTVYQNTSGKTMFVVASMITASGINNVKARSDASNPPTTQVCGNTNNSGISQDAVVSFMVLNGNYYEVVAFSGSITGIDSWVEWV